MSNNRKKNSSVEKPSEEKKKVMFLEQVLPMKYILGGGTTILAAILPIAYNVGKWVQRTDDKFELHQKQVELNEARTQLTLDFNERITKLEKENTRLETLLEIYQGKEVKNGKQEK